MICCPNFPFLFQQLANDIGSIYHLLGLSLIHPSNDSDVVSFAAAAQNALGSNLDAFLVGNVRIHQYLCAHARDTPSLSLIFFYPARLLGTRSVCAEPQAQFQIRGFKLRELRRRLL